jgi:hypothetical protein
MERGSGAGFCLPRGSEGTGTVPRKGQLSLIKYNSYKNYQYRYQFLMLLTSPICENQQKEAEARLREQLEGF